MLLALLGAVPVSTAHAVEGRKAVAGYEGTEKSSSTVERERDLLASIARRQKDLDEREAALRDEEQRLAAIRRDIDGRIEELGRVHSRIEAFVKKIDEVSDERIKRVAKIYASMSPEEAATRLEQLDEKTAVMILANIRERSAAKILAFVNVKKSVELSQKLKIRKISVKR